MPVKSNTVGVALGGGGVRGLAHIPALEAIDDHGITPTAIAGTSMGALIGVLYASGKSGEEIRQFVEQHIVRRKASIKDIYTRKKTLPRLLSAIRVAWKGTGLLKADGFLRYLIEQMGVTAFEDLTIPLHVVATDFYSGEPVVFNSGPLLPALEASMSIPGVFVPVEHGGRVLVDGGISNNLPYDVLLDQCDVTIAVDVSPTREDRDADQPKMVDAILGLFDILVEHVTRTMIELNPPDIHFHPRITAIRILDFDKAADVLKQAEADLAGFKAQLEETEA